MGVMGEQLAELRRSTTDRRVAGVCVMLADRWQVDPLLVRVAALLLTLSSGIGLVLYGAAWALIPPQGSDRAPIDSVLPGIRKLGLKAGIALLIVACIAATIFVGELVPFGIGPAIVIGAVWYFGWYRPEQQRRRAAPSLPEAAGLAARPFTDNTPFTEAAVVWQHRVQEYLDDEPARPGPHREEPRYSDTAHDPGYSLQAFLAHPDPVGLYRADPAAPAAQGSESHEQQPSTAPEWVPQKPTRRRTGRMHVVAWSLTLACVGIVAAFGWSIGLPPFAYLAAVLFAIGLTLIVGAWFQRPRGLVLVGALLAIIIGAMALPMPEGPTTSVTYSSAADLPGADQQDAGTMVTDLSGLTLNEDVTYSVGVDFGRLVVMVPPHTNVQVVWSVDAGEAHILNLHSAVGVDLHDTTISEVSDPDGPTLTIDAHVGVGQLEVIQ